MDVKETIAGHIEQAVTKAEHHYCDTLMPIKENYVQSTHLQSQVCMDYLSLLQNNFGMFAEIANHTAFVSFKGKS